MEVLDRRRIRSGVVEAVEGGECVIASTSLLVWDGAVLAPVLWSGTRALVHRLRGRDALGLVCDVLTAPHAELVERLEYDQRASLGLVVN